MIADPAYGTGTTPIPDHIPGGPPGPGTGCVTGRCPHCGTWHNRELYEAWARFQRQEALGRMQRATRELQRLVAQFTEECKQAREDDEQDRECNAMGRKPQQKWGRWRKRQPDWARERAYIKATRRPR